MNEKEVIKQLINLIDTYGLEKLGIREKLEEEMEKFNRFRYALLEVSENERAKIKETDMKKYAEFILREGTSEEKRKLMVCFKLKIIITKRNIRVHL